MEELVAHCRNQNWELIMGCDANAHHVTWGSEDNNARGKSLYDYITGNNLSVSNRGCTPTFINSRSQTIVDITLTTWHISSLIQNWHVSDCVTLSDHQWINFEINLIKAPKKPFRDPRRTDKDKYRCQLRENLEGVNKRVPRKCGEIEQYVKILQTATRQAFETSCPLRTSQQPNEATKWWCQELTTSRRRQGLRSTKQN